MNTAIQKINTQLNTMSMDGSVLTKNRSVKSLMGVFIALVTVGMSMRPVFADTSTTTTTGNDAISKLLGTGETWIKNANSSFMKIATPLAGACLAVAFFIRMLSKNPRTVEEATVWAKRIFATYLVLVLSNYAFKTIRGLRKDVGDTGTMWTDNLDKTE